MIHSNVIAGIVTYNPEEDRLKENINAIKCQVKEVIIVDNGSSNYHILESFQSDKVKIIYNKNNLGIATALNSIMHYAKENYVDWVITLDQDSIVPKGYVEDSSQLFNEPNLGQIVPILYENITDKYYYLGTAPNNKYQEVSKAITSASITNVSVWENVGKFDDLLFIDYVDYDFSFRVRKSGYKIIRNNSFCLNQQLGLSSIKKFYFFSIRVPNYSSFRRYYIARNIIIFIKKYKWESHPISEVLRLLKMIVLVIFFEDDKFEKIREIKRGIVDGLEMKV
jgi:cpsQ